MNYNARRQWELFIIVKKFAIISGIANDLFCLVGQTPRKLFNTSHPQRFPHGYPTLPIGVQHGIEEDPHLLLQASHCFKGACSPINLSINLGT